MAQTSIDSAERGIVRVVVILDSPEGRMLYGSGSGFVVAPNLVVTAAHVVAAARQRPDYGVAIVPPQGAGLVSAHIISYSPITELALLEFSGNAGNDLTPLTLSTVEPKTGDTVVALGYPDVDYQGTTGADLLHPQPPSRTSGEIASLRDRAPTGDPIPTVNHTAVISSGSSGGPLLDDCGRVIGVNSWHVSGADTRETRGVATRVQQLLQFLDAAGVSPSLAEDRCLSFEERAAADRAATISALVTQNHELAGKLETADRLTRISVVILIGGTLALFVAVCVLGAVLLSRRRALPSASAHEAPIAAPEPFEPHKRRTGVLAVVAGATVAAVLIVAAGVTLLRTHTTATQEAAGVFSGAMSCTLDRAASQGAVGAADVSFTVSGQMCVNGRTLYVPGTNGRYQRAILSPETHGLDVLTIDPRSGEFRRERYPLSDGAFNAARDATAPSDTTFSCDDPEAQAAVQRRNQTLMHFAQGAPAQRFVWRCERR